MSGAVLVDAPSTCAGRVIAADCTAALPAAPSRAGRVFAGQTSGIATAPRDDSIIGTDNGPTARDKNHDA